MEQRHVIKETHRQGHEDRAAAGSGRQGADRLSAQVVPAGVPLQPMPVEVSAKVPQLKAHSFLVRDDKVVIIDPKDNSVAALVE